MATDSVPPRGFTALDAANTILNKDLNVIGVVTDFLPPGSTRGKDCQCTFTLCDLSSSTGQLVKFFRKTIGELPQIRGNGDVVILRQVQALGSHKFSLIKDVQNSKFYDVVGQVVKTFPSNGGGFEVYVSDYTPNENLFNYEWSPPPSSDDYGGPGDEYGYVGRRTNQSWPGPYGKLTLRVTLWPPHSTFAQSTINEGDYIELANIRIKFDQRAQLEGVIHGDRRYPDRICVQLLDKKDRRCLEVLRRKRAYGKKFEKQKGDFLAEVGKPLKRQNEDDSEGSDTARKRKRKRRNEERKAAQNAEENQAPRRNQTKEARDLARRGRKEEVKNERENEIAATSLRSEVNKRGKLDYAPVGPAPWAILTPHLVLCAHAATPITPVSQIIAGTGRTTTTGTNITLDLPFQNVCCRAKVRVIDFFPPNIEDFAVPCDEFEDLSDNSDEESDRDDGQRRQIKGGLRRVDTWEWIFCLLVEDATSKNKTGSGEKRETMKVIVADRDAECLLKMDAKDLRKNPDTLNLLREKLFILWGDLQERKSNPTGSALRELDPNNDIRPVSDTAAKDDGSVVRAGLTQSSAKVFECCIKEYGVLDKKRRQKGDATRGGDADYSEEMWLRRFRMFGTTINAP
ncbi:hypothetical protein FGG08_006315 [Glutinoglossum americanum]|uniref:Protection of telomeres protein 1 n=1 Tax=Glutinoglossum americanum TaxID=1670608 RepID=A0A9P8KXL8_9PEZI|nr:hypothetical protein FGG08_006315 [Glutinoglossum americanum]